MPPDAAVLLGLLAAGVAFGLTPLVARLASRAGAVDHPGERKVHTTTIPRWGGLPVLAGIAVSVGAALLLYPAIAATDHWDGRFLAVFAAGSVAVFAVGALDDLYRLRAPAKLAVQTVAAILIIAVGLRMRVMTNPLTGDAVTLGWLGVPATLLWILLVTNAWNLVDGLDGLAAMLGVIAAVTFALVLIVQHRDASLLFVIPLLGALLGFLPYNMAPARIFLGDSGSYLIGYQIAVISLVSNHKAVASFAVFGPLVVVGLPLADTLIAIARRAFRSGSVPVRERVAGIFRADREHLHHRALARGWSSRKTLTVFSLTAALMGLGGLAITFVRDPRLGGLLLLLAVIFVILFYQRVGSGTDPGEVGPT